MNIAADRPDPLSALLASIEKIVPASPDRDAILQAYSLVKGTPTEKVVDSATLLAGDLIFQETIRETAREFVKAGKPVFYYHFDFPNPFPDPFFGGVAHHFVDVLFLFQTLQEIYPNELSKKVSKEMGRYWLSFAAKGKPDGWKDFKEGVVAVADPAKGWVQRTVDEDRQTPWRREDRWDLIQKIQPYGQTWGDQMSNRRDGFWK
jgi:carboxylesterase type B